MFKNFKALMLIGLLLAPVTAQAASVGNRVPTAGSTVLTDAEMDKAHGKDAPFELAAPVLLIPGVGEAALAAAAVGAAGYLLYRGGAAIYDAVTNNGSSSTVDTVKGDTLAPGNYAGGSIPARGPGRDFTPEERKQINDIGGNTGCHTCGTTTPGTKAGNFIPDHQPPNALNPTGNPQQLYPHCKTCSGRQGGDVTASKTRKP